MKCLRRANDKYRLGTALFEIIFTDVSEATPDDEDVFDISFSTIPKFEGKRVSLTVRAAEGSIKMTKFFFTCTVTDGVQSCELRH
ncbi:hypothetical protein L596_029111 [Steinernema carpocapsae]|uniref:Uncharacterized protein n=1 Tax=Steinernema carpocapsae TaxID=34508 RepID=A0A4V5ZXE3_STECR|nr:hypothetical protein L596_029111 [Steinernema carpocapsae]